MIGGALCPIDIASARGQLPARGKFGPTVQRVDPKQSWSSEAVLLFEVAV